MAKKMRLPNGFGQITKIKNQNLRNPYRAMITVGWSEKGRPICKILKPKGYFPTYNDAYSALVEYNRSPYDLDSEVTLSELYEKWSTKYFAEVKKSRKQAMQAAWRYSHIISHMQVREIRARHIKAVLEEGYINIAGGVRYPTVHVKLQIKTLFNLMLDYALEYELVDKNYARTFNLPKDQIKESQNNRKSHKCFTEEELNILWKRSHHPYVAAILVQCYMGWRPGEIAIIKLSDVDLKLNYIRGGLKTQAGRDRCVPIHSRIRPLVRMLVTTAKMMGSDSLLFPVPERSSYIFNSGGKGNKKKKQKEMNYTTYAKGYKNICESLGLTGHLPHDPRKQFITMAKRAEVDEYVIKRLVGHEIYDITEATYTDRDMDWMARELEKID